MTRSRTLAALPWTVVDALAVGVVVLGMVFAGVDAIVHEGMQKGAAEAPFPGFGVLLAGMLVGPGLLLLVALARIQVSRVAPSSLLGMDGMSGRARLRELLVGAGFGVVLFAAVGLLGMALESLAGEPTLQSAVQWLYSPSIPRSAKAVLCLHAVLLAPVFEEIVFRGVLLAPFVRAGLVGLGVAMITLLFALCHGSLFALLPIAVVGLCLALLALRSGCLLRGIACHIVFNAANLAIVFLFPDAPVP